jgi:antitoxin component HigA of HigAB toxin-antitoxin module
MINIDYEKDKAIASIRMLLKVSGTTQKAFCDQLGVRNRYFNRILNKKQACTLDTYYEYLNKLEKITLKSVTNSK